MAKRDGRWACQNCQNVNQSVFHCNICKKFFIQGYLKSAWITGLLVPIGFILAYVLYSIGLPQQYGIYGNFVSIPFGFIILLGFFLCRKYQIKYDGFQRQKGVLASDDGEF